MFSLKKRLIHKAVPTLFVKKPNAMATEYTNNVFNESEFILSNQSIQINDVSNNSPINGLPSSLTSGNNFLFYYYKFIFYVPT